MQSFLKILHEMAEPFDMKVRSEAKVIEFADRIASVYSDMRFLALSVQSKVELFILLLLLKKHDVDFFFPEELLKRFVEPFFVTCELCFETSNLEQFTNANEMFFFRILCIMR